MCAVLPRPPMSLTLVETAFGAPLYRWLLYASSTCLGLAVIAQHIAPFFGQRRFHHEIVY
jgi:hypothetical protein